MHTVVIIGATGVVGSRALQHLLARSDVASVLALGRRPLPLSHAKLRAPVIDLADASAIEREIPDGTSVAISCLGTTLQRAGSKAAFRAVDRDAVVSFARAALRRGAARFLLVSSIGADPRSRSFYLRTKGETEQALTQLGFAQLTLVRPSVIDDQGARREHRLGERIGLPLARALFAIAGRTSRYAPISADSIGQALARLAVDDTTDHVRVVESERLHALGR